MVDFHVHCDYSIDAQGSVEEYAEAALSKGLSQICFTTHCDLDPHRRHHDGRVRLRGQVVDVTSAWLSVYLDDIRKMAGVYRQQGLKILCGLELGYTPGIEDLIEPVVSSFEFDFILGGVHTLGGIDIVSSRECEAYFSTRSPRELCEEYYHDVGEAVGSGLFDCLAHIDIYKRCGQDFYGESLASAHRGLVEPVLDEMARRNVSLEINSGGLRKGLAWPYPSPDILEAARVAGIWQVTPGSDCHRPDDVGYRLAWCLGLAAGAGFDRITIFEARARAEIPLGGKHEQGQESIR